MVRVYLFVIRYGSTAPGAAKGTFVASPSLLRLPSVWLCFLPLRIGADGGRRLPILPFAAKATSAANEGIVSLKISVKKKTMQDEKCFMPWTDCGRTLMNSSRASAKFSATRMHGQCACF